MRLVLLALLFLFSNNLLAQNVLKGKIFDDSGSPISGATISVKNKPASVMSGNDGSFSINTSIGDVLIFSNVGYETKELTISNTDPITISVSRSTQSLGEVVVTSLGIVKNKRALSYSAQTINTQDISKARDLNVANSLNGKVAGISVTQTSSGLGGSSRVVLRGDRSIAGSNQALYVVDGVPIDNTQFSPPQMASGGRDGGDGISAINPDDIETINVLKGANATALYGARGANGVIIITTKKGAGKKGIGINFSSGIQFEMPYFLRKFQNVYGQGAAGVYNSLSEQNWGPKLDGSQVKTWSKNPDKVGKTYSYVAHDENYRNFYTTGKDITNNISFSYGADKVQTYFSYTNTYAKGIVDNNSLKRNNINFRINNKFTERLSLDAKITYLKQTVLNRMAVGDAYENVNKNIIRVPRNIAPDDLVDIQYKNSAGFIRQNFWNPNSSTAANPYWTKYNNTSNEEKNRLIGFASLTYKLLPELSLMIRSGIDRTQNVSEYKLFNDTYVSAPKGNYIINEGTIQELNNDFLVTYDKNVSSHLNINANFGGNTQNFRMFSTAINNGGLVIENLFTTNNAIALAAPTDLYERKKQSLYGTVDFGYKNYLTLNLTGRNDWSSTLPYKNNSYFFSSAGISAIISDMFKLPESISYAKIRASIAQTGNDAEPYMLTQTYTISSGGNSVFVMRDPIKPIVDLKPEMTLSKEIGAELRFLQNRLGADITYYITNSKNQLINSALPSASGWTAQYVNAGNIQNNGLEVTLLTTPIKTSDFKWDATINYAKNNNKVLEISPSYQQLTLQGDYMNVVKLVKGKPYGELFSRGYSRDQAGRILVNASGIPIITGANTVYIGNTRAKWRGGVLNKFNYKNAYLSFVINGRFGGVVSSFTNSNLYADGSLEKTLEGRDGFIFNGVFADGTANTKTITAEQYWKIVGGKNSPAGEVFTYDATNVRLSELVLGYSLPKTMLQKLPVNNINLALTGRNLFFLVNKADGFDPEMVVGTANSYPGIESYSPPPSRFIGVNITVGF